MRRPPLTLRKLLSTLDRDLQHISSPQHHVAHPFTPP
jgi:hypothetical protein